MVLASPIDYEVPKTKTPSLQIKPGSVNESRSREIRTIVVETSADIKILPEECCVSSWAEKSTKEPHQSTTSRIGK